MKNKDNPLVYCQKGYKFATALIESAEMQFRKPTII